MKAKFFNYILQGSEATEENAIQAARGLDWQEVETTEANYPNLQYVGTLNGVGIYYNYGSDDYYFTDEDAEDDYEPEVKEKEPFQQVDALGDLGNFNLNENMRVKKITKKITKNQLQGIIKEGVQNLHKRTLLENEKKYLIEELVLIEGEVMPMIDSKKILKSYIEAALWTEQEKEGLEDATMEYVNDDSIIDAWQDVKRFVLMAGSLLDGIDEEQIGYDLWLTRNSHGAGFWDRGLGDVGDALTKLASSMGEKHLFWGEDGKINIE